MREKFAHCYVVSSERSAYRSDERECMVYTNVERQIGDTYKMDGIWWTVEEVIY